MGETAEDTKDESQSKLLEAKMRADLLRVVSERDASQKESMVAKRSVQLLQTTVEHTKKDVAKLRNDKALLERELRQARSMADSLSKSLLSTKEGSTLEDLDFYKQKSNELEARLRGMTACLAEKNQEIAELRRCNNRNVSQQRLQSLRGET